MQASLLALLMGGLAAMMGGLGGGGKTPQDDDSTPANGDGDNSSDVTPAQTPTPASYAPDYDAGYDDPFNAAGWQGLTEEEQLIVELVNRARMDPNAEVTRLSEALAPGASTSPVQPLAVTPELSHASDLHSMDMDNRDYFAHNNPEGMTPAQRALAVGHGSGYIGENLGWVGSTSTSFPVQPRVEMHHENLWESDGHQVNLLRTGWSEIGVGYDYGDYRGYNGSTFVTEMFGDRGQTYLTGVVIEDGDGDRFYDIGEGQGGVNITATNGSDNYYTATWDAGGYSLALPSGTYDVVFEGGDLSARYETTVTIGSQNVKLDVIDQNGSSIAVSSLAHVPGSEPEASQTLSEVSDFLPQVPFDESTIPVEEEFEEEDLLIA